MFITNEITFNGYNVYNLDLLYIIAILLGILVIVTKNPIVSVLFLIGLFLTISGYLILTGLNFIGLSYLLVYVGAVSILFLFILMLINVRISELLTDNINSIPLAIIVGVFFNFFVNNVLPNMKIDSDILNNIFEKKTLNTVTSISWDGFLVELSHISAIGNILYVNYSLWLLLTSGILLLAMVGAIVITLKPQTENLNSNIEELEEIGKQSSFSDYFKQSISFLPNTFISYCKRPTLKRPNVTKKPYIYIKEFASIVTQDKMITIFIAIDLGGPHERLIPMIWQGDIGKFQRDLNNPIRYNGPHCIVDENKDNQLAEDLLIKFIKDENICVCNS